MTYSCGIYPELDADLRLGQGYRRLGGRDGVDELEQAQLAKIRYIIKKADIRPGMRVLEIGSGWGSFSIEVSRWLGHVGIVRDDCGVFSPGRIGAFCAGADSFRLPCLFLQSHPYFPYTRFRKPD